MKIKVILATFLREITGKKEDVLQSPCVITVGELLINLSKKYGRGFKEYLYDEKGEVRTYIRILINGSDVNVLEGLETKLKEGDTVIILPPVSGG